MDTAQHSHPSNSSLINSEGLLRNLERGGLRIVARSGNLVVRPSQAITPETRELIRKNKSDLLRLVRTKPLNAERLAKLRKLYSPPGISALDFLLAIHPRTGTYLDLPRNSVIPKSKLRIFAKALELGLETSKTMKHFCRNRDSRKELIMLAAILIPANWYIQVIKNVLMVIPLDDEPKIKERSKPQIK